MEGTRGRPRRRRAVLALAVGLLCLALPTRVGCQTTATATDEIQAATPLALDRRNVSAPVVDGFVSDDWVMSVVDASLSTLYWPSASYNHTEPESPDASVLVLTAQRFGYLNLRLSSVDEAVSDHTHICMNVLVSENSEQPAAPQTIFTLTGYSAQRGGSLSVSAHTILESNPDFIPNAWAGLIIPLPDMMSVKWYEMRMEEVSVQGAVILLQSIRFCDGGGEAPAPATYAQCVWKSDLSLGPDLLPPAVVNREPAMPFIEPVYLSGFGLSPRWTDKSYVGFYDFSYILPSGETAVKALVGPGGALSFGTSTSFQRWEALHFQILASSSELAVCLEVDRENQSRGEAQCVDSLWNQSDLASDWVDVGRPLADFGPSQPWTRLDLVDGSDLGIFYLVTNVLFNGNRSASARGIWVVDVETLSELEQNLLNLPSSYAAAGSGSGSTHVLGWSVGIVVGAVAAVILIPVLICIVFPKQPGRRLTSVPLCCVAWHESVQEALEDLSSYRYRFRIPNTVKMKAADKKGWVETVSSRPPEEGGAHDMNMADSDSPQTTTCNLESILPVYTNGSGGGGSKAGSRETAHSALARTASGLTPLSSERGDLMYHTHYGGSVQAEDFSHLLRPGTSPVGPSPKPLYKVSSILECEADGPAHGIAQVSPAVPVSNRSEMSYRRFSNLQHIDDALKASCKVLMQSSNDLKKLLHSNNKGGRHVRRVASETIDMSVASDYHTLIEKQILSLQQAQSVVAEEWRIMREIASTSRSDPPPPRQVVEKVPSRTDVESMNVDIFKDVQITSLIGCGGGGKVYHGFYKGHCVAIKLLHNNNGLTADQVDALRTEVALLQDLRHPNIVNFLGCCLQPPQVCVILEYAEGGSLHNMLHTQQKQPEYGTLLQLAEDVASAMDYCHSLDPPIIHRDLKPQNILLRRDGRAQVADFGIARIRHSTFVETKHLNAGTVAYMSPEIMQGRNVDEKCDVYSFGVIMWECLTGEKPWADKLLPMQVVVAVGVEGERLPLPMACPISLKRLIKDCWRHDPRLRPTFREIKLRLAYLRNKHGTH